MPRQEGNEIMRILWYSCSPFCGSGYGMQTASMTRLLKQAGHNVAIFAFYGIQGAQVDTANGIPIYPNDAKGYGVELVQTYFDHFKADICISLVDIWVLKNMPKIPWYPWVPCDHEPTIPGVEDVLKNSSIAAPIAMSKFGQREIERITGKKPVYIPHGIDCELFVPDENMRKEVRKSVGFNDKFVIGTVATNCNRKNWNASMIAVSKLYKKHKDIVWYMHTKPFDSMGGDLAMARHLYGLDKVCCFPKQVELYLGISQEAMARAYNSMDVFLLPSMGEGFGLPAIEAQACEVPVILANNTAQAELFGGGWQLKKGNPVYDIQSSFYYDSNPDEIYDCLEQAYSEWESGKLRKRGKAARIFAEQFDEIKVFKESWTPFLDNIEKGLGKSKVDINKQIEEAIDAAIGERAG